MTSLVELLSRLARCSSGSVLVEATIYMPIAISLMVGGVDFGMAFSAQATVEKSVRDAARFLASLPIPPISATRLGCSTWAIAKAKNLAVYGNLSGTGPALISGWQTGGGANNQVNVDCSNADKILVSAKAPYTTLMLGAVLPGVGTFTLSAQHEECTDGQPTDTCG
jgi:Flp pilus assembly protein TadG